MSEIVFDSSAIIAFINDELGKEAVGKYLQRAVMSTVNLAETIGYYGLQRGVPAAGALIRIKNMLFNVVSFDEEQALLAGELKALTKKQGLSLGDCACLALAKIKNLPVLTADKAWQKIDVGVKIELIR